MSSRESQRRFWSSMEELEQQGDLRECIEREFPSYLPVYDEATTRRKFLQLMGASLGLAGLYGCSASPDEKIVPYVHSPAELIPGKPLFFATAASLGGIANGVLAESHMGRPTKLEGNPDHPGSLGASDLWTQAECLSLYDPDRLQAIFGGDEIQSWGRLLSELTRQLEEQGAKKGRGLRLLTETITSPTLLGQIKRLLEKFPEAKWHRWEPVNFDNILEGTQLAFGDGVWPIYRFDKADVVLSLDADFLVSEPGRVRYARDFVARRRKQKDAAREMNRLYVLESAATSTGAFADHRLPASPAQVISAAQTLANRLGVDVPRPADVSGELERWLDVVADDLQRPLGKQGGVAVVVPGLWQPPEVHALAHAINLQLGSVGVAVEFVAPMFGDASLQRESIAELASDMRSGEVEMIAILGGNPVFNTPADLDFAAALESVPFRLHQTQERNETSALCPWLVPQSHFLESWSDGCGFDGTATLQQPLIDPLYDSKSIHDLISVLLGEASVSAHDAVQSYWRKRQGEDRFEEFWRTSLHDGFVADSFAKPHPVSITAAFPTEVGQRLSAERADRDGVMEVVFRPDPNLWDGRYANNAWLRELPKPLTKVTWDNPAILSPADAKRLGLRNGEMVEVAIGERRLEIPIWIQPGQSSGVVTLYFGDGREVVGGIGAGHGFNVFKVRTTDGPWHASQAILRKTGETFPLAATNTHHRLDGRELIRVGTQQALNERPTDPPFMTAAATPEGEKSLFPSFAYDGNKWGMSIDGGACTGCNACVIACQAENNIPVVGKEEVLLGRELHWLRIDNYYEGPAENPSVYQNPIPCMHCENAPCEIVCPVAATTHSNDGLNQMVYNRCVGTRYCSNNCPYKVRRFNFYQYSDYETPVTKLLSNPDVTVRSRGVMEKCTYCIQRISAVRIDAEKELRPISDGEIQTACQQVCPTQAITFGDLNDPASHVRALHDSPLSYGLLTELTTRPRTRYLAVIRNPNERLTEEVDQPHE